MTCSIIVPTKDRPKELLSLVRSIIKQIRLPDQVIIIDQSSHNNINRTRIINILKKKNISNKYIEKNNLTGLVDAKKYSLQYNSSDIITFLDDDIILMPTYLQNICLAFQNNFQIKGANGLILNKSKQNIFKKTLFNLTHIGLYKDDRGKTIKTIDKDKPIQVNTLSGGISSWRREIFNNTQFDNKNFFHFMEDVEFSIRFKKKYKAGAYLIPNAELFHYHIESNAENKKKQILMHVKECFMIFKKNRRFSILGLDLTLILLYYLIYSIYFSFKNKNINYLFSFLIGMIRGINIKIK